MKTTADYLDELRAHFNAPSDYALQDHTGWQRQQISRYRTKKSTFDDATAEKVAGWLGVQLATVLIDMNAQRAKSERVRKAWLSVAADLHQLHWFMQCESWREARARLQQLVALPAGAAPDHGPV